MSGFYPDHFKDPPKKSPGEKQVEAGGNLVKLLRALGLRVNSPRRVEATEIVGEMLIERWPKLAKLFGVKP